MADDRSDLARPLPNLLTPVTAQVSPGNLARGRDRHCSGSIRMLRRCHEEAQAGKLCADGGVGSGGATETSWVLPTFLAHLEDRHNVTGIWQADFIQVNEM